MTTVHLVKLSVGTETIQGLADWQSTAQAQGPDGAPRHVTRMWPKKSAELLNGGSIYWVIKGVILCRQRIVRLDEVTRSDGILRCALVLDPNLIRTSPAPKRPFQGWRYLQPGDAPADLSDLKANETPLPPQLEAALSEIGVL
ncbi:MAG: DUF1489 domain-containing protein [Pseudomonadota bacterium]